MFTFTGYVGGIRETLGTMVVTDRYENGISQEEGVAQCCAAFSAVREEKRVIHVGARERISLTIRG